MDNKKIKIEHIVRLIIIAVVLAATRLIYTEVDLGHYLLLLLIFILNTQVRINFLENKLFLMSLFIDMGMLVYIYTTFGGLTYLLIYITLIDSLIFLKEEGYIISAIILLTSSYLLRATRQEVIILNLLIFSVVSIFAHHMRRMIEKMSEVELLYDQNRRYSYQLEDAKKRLEEYSKKVEGVSQLEERNRISRDIHDNIGHKLTGVLMQLEASIRVMDVDNQKGREMLGSVKDNMYQCTETLRQTVRNMKPKEYGSRILSIQQMLKDFSKNTGINITFEIQGNPVKLYPSGEVTLYKNAQEAVTNAVRHGKAKNIAVKIIYKENQVTLTVKDDGLGCSTMVKGMGISGMEERVTLIGGELHIINENGFEVRSIVPIR